MIRQHKEKDLQNAILKYLRYRGIFCWRQNVGAVKIGERFMTFGMPGMSDILGILPGGKFLAVEVKAGKRGRITLFQTDFLTRIRHAGGVAMVARDLQGFIEEFETVLKALKSPTSLRTYPAMKTEEIGARRGAG